MTLRIAVNICSPPPLHGMQTHDPYRYSCGVGDAGHPAVRHVEPLQFMGNFSDVADDHFVHTRSSSGCPTSPMVIYMVRLRGSLACPPPSSRQCRPNFGNLPVNERMSFALAADGVRGSKLLGAKRHGRGRRGTSH